MAQSEVTREEFDLMKIDHERVSIALDSLTREVADLSERVNVGFEAVDARLDVLTTKLAEFKQAASAHHDEILAAIVTLGRSR